MSDGLAAELVYLGIPLPKASPWTRDDAHGALLEHVEVEPTHDNGWASWYCRTCDQPCASDNPCDHCDDDG